MTKLLLTIHVLAAIIAIGPVTVAASMFPAATRRAEVTTLRTLHRICRVYAALGVVVPVFGLATAVSLGVLGNAWLLTSIALTVIAAAVLGLAVLPGQAAVLAGLTAPASTPAQTSAPAQAPAHPSTRADARAQAPTPAQTSTQAQAQAQAPAYPSAQGPAFTDGRRAARRLGMVTGIFNMLWAVVVVLMIVRPGSTTGA